MPRRRPPPEDAKAAALRAAGALHPRPERVQDEAFARHEFFDRRDRVQVKYEMLRRHRVDGRPVTEVAAAFGSSRQAFYTRDAAFTAGGDPRAPAPAARAPARPQVHRRDPGLRGALARRARGPTSAAAWRTAVQHRFGVTIHPRSLARALARREKKRRAARRPTAVSPSVAIRDAVLDQYEALRREATETRRAGRGAMGSRCS